MNGYKYCVKARFSSEYYTQPDWVTLSFHKTKDGAERQLAFQKKSGGKNRQVAIFNIK